MHTVKIKKGWFRSAGHQYHWGPGYDPAGVGIHKDLLFEHEKLIVEVNHHRYLVNCQQAVDFVRANKSYYVMPGGSKIGVISKSLLTDYVES